VTYEIEVSSPAIASGGTHMFTGEVEGYASIAPATFTIRNTGIGAMTDLDISLSGTDAASFNLDQSGLNTSLASDGFTSFTINPVDGLLAGTYNVTVTITDTNLGADYTFDVGFTVTAAKSVSVGAQSGTLTAGIAGTVTFPVSTVSIGDGIYPASVSSLPAGVTVQGQVTISSNSGTLTLAGNTSTVAGTASALQLTIDGETSNNFTLVISTTVLPPTTATITGPTSMTLKTGYAATSTEAYTITGTSPVTVTKTSGDAMITWNNATKKLDIAEGLSAGKYSVTLRASNSGGSSTLIFELTVENPVFWIEINAFTGGKVESVPVYVAEEDETVTLTITPNEGYELESIIVHQLNNASVIIPLNGTGNTRTFTMPTHHVNVAAVFKFTGTSVEVVQSGLKAYVQDGTLYVSGLTAGRTLYIYNILGTLIAPSNSPEGGELAIPLPGRGVYIVTDGKETVKVAN
jgi:hypothetical protein